MASVYENLMMSEFSGRFGGSPRLFRAPGRINLIGEHTDYNSGLVLPAAINLFAYAAVSRRDDETIRLYSFLFDEQVETTAANAINMPPWARYILGVVNQMMQKDIPPGGFDLMLHSDIPMGAGLASSAAISVVTAFSLNEIFSCGLSKADLAVIARDAEYDFAGVKCGIMDQFASVFGRKDHVIRLDCRDLQFEYIPMKMHGYRLVLLDTHIRHSLASSEYNIRRDQCGESVALVHEKYAQVQSLRDITGKMLEELVKPVNPESYRICRFILEENNRVEQAAEDLRNGNFTSLGEKMFRSHDGLSREYQVSTPELDFLVDQVRDNRHVAGARMMGGGFGGCTINLVNENALEDLVHELSVKYREKTGLDLAVYLVDTADGALEMQSEKILNKEVK